jgi:nucleotide-binding universal stress UspA family protein
MPAMAALGFALNFWAWALPSPLGPRFQDDLVLSSFEQALLVAVPVVVGSLGRIPAGALSSTSARTRPSLHRLPQPRPAPAGHAPAGARLGKNTVTHLERELRTMTDPIVVGTDGSPGASRAVRWAADEAALRRLPLHIVHAIDRGLYELPLFAPGQIAESVAEAGEETLAEAARTAREHRPGIEVTTELVAEAIAVALADRSRRAFELVVGHRGRGGFASLLLGSTGLRLAGHTAAPVVIVRGDAPPAGGEVVAGVDLVSDPTGTLRYAFDAAAVRGARVRVLHAWRVNGPALPGEGRGAGAAEIVEKLEQELVRAQAPVREDFPGVEVVADLVREHPVTALCEASRGASLVVVGTHDHNWLNVPGLGSVSHGVIHHAHSPVAVIHPA